MTASATSKASPNTSTIYKNWVATRCGSIPASPRRSATPAMTSAITRVSPNATAPMKTSRTCSPRRTRVACMCCSTSYRATRATNILGSSRAAKTNRTSTPTATSGPTRGSPAATDCRSSAEKCHAMAHTSSISSHSSPRSTTVSRILHAHGRTPRSPTLQSIHAMPCST